MAAPSAIADDLPCVGCGFDLSGLSSHRLCPECTRPVAASLGQPYLRDAPSAWLTRVTVGIALMLAADGASLANHLLIRLPWDSRFEGVRCVLIGAACLLAFAGIWLGAPALPAGLGPQVREVARGARISAAATLALYLTALIAIAAHGGFDWGDTHTRDWFALQGLAGAIAAMAALARVSWWMVLREYARRLPAPGAAQMCRLLAAGSGAVFLLTSAGTGIALAPNEPSGWPANLHGAFAPLQGCHWPLDLALVLLALGVQTWMLARILPLALGRCRLPGPSASPPSPPAQGVPQPPVATTNAVGAAPVSETIADTLLCGVCGYNLRGLTADRTCPECGHPIARSLGRRPLDEAPRSWRWRVSTGIALMIPTLVPIPLIQVLDRFGFRGLLTSDYRWLGLVLLGVLAVAPLLTLAATWLGTAAPPPGFTLGIRRWRSLARLAQLGASVLVLVHLGASLAIAYWGWKELDMYGYFGPDYDALRAGEWVLIATAVTGWWLVLRGYARSLSSPRLSRLCTFALWGNWLVCLASALDTICSILQALRSRSWWPPKADLPWHLRLGFGGLESEWAAWLFYGLPCLSVAIAVFSIAVQVGLLTRIARGRRAPHEL